VRTANTRLQGTKLVDVKRWGGKLQLELLKELKIRECKATLHWVDVRVGSGS
jgi:hypothetical protein